MAPRSRGDRENKDEAGDFDVYLLAQTWAPTFCCTAPSKCTTVSWAFSATHLSLHGLWPGFVEPRGGGRTFPTNCANDARVIVGDLPRSFIDFAPAYCAYDGAKHKPLIGQLGLHEWKKHGACTSLAPAQYFAEAVRVMEGLKSPSGVPMTRGTPPAVKASLGSVHGVPETTLRASYAKSVAIRVNRRCQLEEITTCWTKSADGAVGEQAHCPAHVLQSARNSLRGQKCPSVLVPKLGQCGGAAPP